MEGETVYKCKCGLPEHVFQFGMCAFCRAPSRIGLCWPCVQEAVRLLDAGEGR